MDECNNVRDSYFQKGLGRLRKYKIREDDDGSVVKDNSKCFTFENNNTESLEQYRTSSEIYSETNIRSNLNGEREKRRDIEVPINTLDSYSKSSLSFYDNKKDKFSKYENLDNFKEKRKKKRFKLKIDDKGNKSDIEIDNFLSKLDVLTSAKKQSANIHEYDLNKDNNMSKKIYEDSLYEDNLFGSINCNLDEKADESNNMVVNKTPHELNINIEELSLLEKLLIPFVFKDDSILYGVKEWIPSTFFNLKSNIISNLDNSDCNKVDGRSLAFFYEKWIEQYGYLACITNNFTRPLIESFVFGNNIQVCRDTKKYPNYFLDINDSVVVSVQDNCGRVVLSKLISVANTQLKLIKKMNENKDNLNSVDQSERLRWGLISIKSRTKLWWLCRAAQHCKYIDKHGKTYQKYSMNFNNQKITSLDIGNSIDTPNSLSTIASINTAKDTTMDLFENDTKSDIDYSDTDNKLKIDENLDSKWNEILDLSTSNKMRPWEKWSKDRIDTKGLYNLKDLKSEYSNISAYNTNKNKKTENIQGLKFINIEKSNQKSNFDSQYHIFKFMLYNLGPMPTWTTLNNKSGDDLPIYTIIIEPPKQLSLREQSQTKIRRIKLKKQAENLAINHFDILDSKTMELKVEKLKHWNLYFNLNLFLPEYPNIKKVKIESVTENELKKINSSISQDNILNLEEPVDNLRHNFEILSNSLNNTSYSLENSESCDELNKIYEKVDDFIPSLPLEIEYISDEQLDNLDNDGEVDYIEDDIIHKINKDGNSIDSEYSIKKDIKHIKSSFENSIIGEEISEQIINTSLDNHEKINFANNLDNGIKENLSPESLENQNLVPEILTQKQRVAYNRLKKIRIKKRKLIRKIKEEYGHLLEQEAEESENDDNIYGLHKITKQSNDLQDEDDDNDLDWDEISDISDLIDNGVIDDEIGLNGDAMQAHLKHIQEIEEKQYRQLFTLEGLKERKSSLHNFLNLVDDNLDGETRIERRRNEMSNHFMYMDDVISELWTDDEYKDDEYEDEILNDDNLATLIGVDTNYWKKFVKFGSDSQSENGNEIDKLRQSKFEELKRGLIKEASSQIKHLKQIIINKDVNFNNNNNSNNMEKSIIDLSSMAENINKEINHEVNLLDVSSEKQSIAIKRLEELLQSIHLACHRCIYLNSHVFDHIEISDYLEKRQVAKKIRKTENIGNNKINKDIKKIDSVFWKSENTVNNIKNPIMQISNLNNIKSLSNQIDKKSHNYFGESINNDYKSINKVSNLKITKKFIQRGGGRFTIIG
ncbi:uncharacterized protein CMU_019830 [Cryptosporidium muris RN66]|uniref:Uncharacterized protein n=1 Tax=Cryptosporidium muris (strain RN66) TaxID=441375 RepID=B6AJA2_CRYMR|nr:uncharacterized protein CMU_019830 [Cryptosporidium muris RN66]EEA08240.1 hypothetical protein, conserved [Cryptosporidium muris RN66]|eukprot:XP_002142589.1 hypothetical protein [Cryptosporidium muris RN66]